jgi:hypothetical protein
MHPTHIGRSPTGSRMHLADARGWTACSRRMARLEPIEQCDLEVDAPYCQSCLRQLVDRVKGITVFGVEGLEREERWSAGRWDGRAEFEIGRFISDYLHENPPHPSSEIADELRELGERLQAGGRERFEAFGGAGLGGGDA